MHPSPTQPRNHIVVDNRHKFRFVNCASVLNSRRGSDSTETLHERGRSVRHFLPTTAIMGKTKVINGLIFEK